MSLSKTTRLAVGAGLCACGLLFAGSASALPQFTPNPTQFLHTPLSGEAGAEWNTGGDGTQLSYNSGILTITGFVDVLNYYDTASGSGCETDSGSNCDLNYDPDLDFELTASFVDVAAAFLGTHPITGNDLYELTFNFETAGGDDLTVTDDGSIQLLADVVAGSYNGDATTGLIASVIYDSTLGVTTTDVIDGAGVLNVTGGPHSSLFGDPFFAPLFGLSLAAIDSFDDGAGGGLSEIVTVAYNTGSLPDFTAEASGQMYRIESGNFFIPEPGTALLAGLGLGVLGLARRRARG